MKENRMAYPIVGLKEIQKYGSVVKSFSGKIYEIKGGYCYLKQEFIVGKRKNTIHRTKMNLTYLYPNIRWVKDSSGITIAKRLNEKNALISTNKGILRRKNQSTIKEVKAMSDRLLRLK